MRPQTPTGIASDSERIVRHLLDAVAPRHAAEKSVLRGEIGLVVTNCLALVANGVGEPSIRMHGIRRAAARWARVGFPIDAVHHLVQEGFRLHLDAHTPDAVSTAWRSTETRRLIEALHAVTAAVSMAYLDSGSAASAEEAELHALSVALLRGHHTSKIGREHNVPVADRYVVLALAIGDIDEAPIARPNVLELLRDRLGGLAGRPIPALLSDCGGTLLVPLVPAGDQELHRLIIGLAATTPVTATAVIAAPEQIPTATDRAHELLDIVERLRWGPGIYHFDDLAVEYQLTRPGPGRDLLATILDPLEDHPELFDTLREHIRNGLNRRLTARALHIHQNTIDHRLKRIGQLVGLDAGRAEFLWRLRAALIVRSYVR
ncbi:PucR family transcriptional regulator [Nocardia sp. CA-129566]|uniref:PucR family transcriptional regulator n=1 Tax=Nocardia sp. CA-129566 TaxID=3239976 RepID=UPI003D98168F